LQRLWLRRSDKMKSLNTNKRPRWALIVSILFLLWNLIGLASFTMQWMMTPTDIAKLPPDQQELWGNMAGWIWAAYAVAVGAGTLGAVGLVLAKKWAEPLFLISMIAILIQFSTPLIYALENKLMALMIFPAFILAMAVIEWLCTRNWREKGWLS
jgi:hypothetical protein